MQDKLEALQRIIASARSLAHEALAELSANPDDLSLFRSLYGLHFILTGAEFVVGEFVDQGRKMDAARVSARAANVKPPGA